MVRSRHPNNFLFIFNTKLSLAQTYSLIPTPQAWPNITRAHSQTDLTDDSRAIQAPPIHRPNYAIPRASFNTHCQEPSHRHGLNIRTQASVSTAQPQSPMVLSAEEFTIMAEHLIHRGPSPFRNSSDSTKLNNKDHGIAERSTGAEGKGDNYTW
jgi:hypothetical protein